MDNLAQTRMIMRNAFNRKIRSFPRFELTPTEKKLIELGNIELEKRSVETFEELPEKARNRFAEIKNKLIGEKFVAKSAKFYVFGSFAEGKAISMEEDNHIILLRNKVLRRNKTKSDYDMMILGEVLKEIPKIEDFDFLFHDLPFIKKKIEIP